MEAVHNRLTRRVWTEIGVILAIKAVALTAIYFAFFSAPAAPPDIAGKIFSGHLFADRPAADRPISEAGPK